MPNVPYSPVPDVAPSMQGTPGFNIQASPAAFGAGVGQAVEGLGQTISKSADTATQIAVQYQERQNNIAVDKAYHQFLDKSNNTLTGDPNDPNDHGYFGKQGQDAVDARAGVVQSLEDSRQAIRAGLANPVQQLAFDQQSKRLNAYTTQRLGDHYEQQYTKSAMATFADTQAGFERSAAIDYNNDEHFKHLIADATGNADKMSGVQGATDPVFAANRDTALQRLYAARAVAMGNADPAAAETFVRANINAFNPDVAHRLLGEFKGKADTAGDDAYVKGLFGTGPATAPVTAPASATTGPRTDADGKSPTLASIHPDLTTIAAPSGAKFTVARAGADAFSGFLQDLEASGYKVDPSESGGYNPRNIAGTNTPSMHAYGLAIDVNWQQNQRGASTSSDLPSSVAGLAAKWGLTTGPVPRAIRCTSNWPRARRRRQPRRSPDQTRLPTRLDIHTSPAACRWQGRVRQPPG
jgi:hypothetical protein